MLAIACMGAELDIHLSGSGIIYWSIAGKTSSGGMSKFGKWILSFGSSNLLAWDDVDFEHSFLIDKPFIFSSRWIVFHSAEI